MLNDWLSAVQARLSRKVGSVGKQPVVGLSLTLEPAAPTLMKPLSRVRRNKADAASLALALGRCNELIHGYLDLDARRCARFKVGAPVDFLRAVINSMSGFQSAA